MFPTKSSLTPKGRNWMVTAPEVAPPWRTGKGNSPPARKLAFCPLIAMRFGSARISRTDVCCRAWIAAPRLRSGRKRKIFKRLVKLNGMAEPVLPVVVEPAAVLVVVVVLGMVPVMVGGENCWVEI